MVTWQRINRNWRPGSPGNGRTKGPEGDDDVAGGFCPDRYGGMLTARYFQGYSLGKGGGGVASDTAVT